MGALLVGLAGCGREPGFEDRTARVIIDGDTTTYEVDGCGLDGQTVFVLGRADDGRVLQAVVGVETDGQTGVTASTGMSVTDGKDPVSAFGAEAWARRGRDGEAPGAISSARVRGARIQASGRAQRTEPGGHPTAAGAVAFTLDARCDQRDGG